MYGITNKFVTLVTQQVTSEGDVERATTEKKDISSTSSSDGNAAQKIVQKIGYARREIGYDQRIMETNVAFP